MARIALFEHVKLKRLCRELGIGRPLAVGLFEMLAYYAGQHNIDGDLSNMSDADIEMAVEWEGEPGAFVNAMLACRLLDRIDGGIVIHDWIEWAPDWVGARLRARKQYDRRHPPSDSPQEEIPLVGISRVGISRVGASDAVSTKPAQVCAGLRRESNGPSIPPTPDPDAPNGRVAAAGGTDGPAALPGCVGDPALPASATTHLSKRQQPGAAGLDAAQIQADIDARIAAGGGWRDGMPAVVEPKPGLDNAIPFHVEHSKGATEAGYPPQTPMQQHVVDETDRDAEPNGRHGLPVAVYDALVAGWGNNGGRGLSRAWVKVKQLVDESGGDTGLALAAIAHLRETKGRAVDILTVAASIQKAKSEAAARGNTTKRHERVIFGETT